MKLLTLLILFNSSVIFAQNFVLSYKRYHYFTNDDTLRKNPYDVENLCYVMGKYLIKQEIYTTVYSRTDSPNVERIAFKIDHYNFFKLGEKWKYEFSNFSNKTKLQKKIKLEEPFSENNYSSIRIDEQKFSMTDTIIDNVNYQRFYIVNDKIKDSLTYTAKFYTRCNIKNSIFSLERKYDNENECNIVRRDSNISSSDIWLVNILDYQRSYLNKKEKRIFRKWIKLAKKNPV
jgi:hypothetical protein